ncbi:hypothetical protein [uncultured Streptomyces sp.]|nr:hypothetical protein [uncultured Streptomyces sp.]
MTVVPTDALWDEVLRTETAGSASERHRYRHPERALDRDALA